jgi:hypothetical protein
LLTTSIEDDYNTVTKTKPDEINVKYMIDSNKGDELGIEGDSIISKVDTEKDGSISAIIERKTTYVFFISCLLIIILFLKTSNR